MDAPLKPAPRQLYCLAFRRQCTGVGLWPGAWLGVPRPRICTAAIA